MTNQTARTLCPYSLAPEARPQAPHWSTCSSPMAWADVMGLTSLYSAPLYLASSSQQPVLMRGGGVPARVVVCYYQAKVTVQPLEVTPSGRLGWAEQGPALFSGADAVAWANLNAHRARQYSLVAAETRRAPASVRLLVSSAPAGTDTNNLQELLAYAKSLLARYSASKKQGQATKKGARRATLREEVLALPLKREEAREAKAWLSRQLRAKERASSERIREDKRRREYAQDLLLAKQVALASAATDLVDTLAKEGRVAPASTQALANRIPGQTNPETGAIWTGNPKRERVAPRKVKRAGLNLSLLS